MKSLLSFLIVCGLLLMLGCSKQGEGDQGDSSRQAESTRQQMSSFRGDLEHTGVYGARALRGPVKLVWSFPAKGRIRSSPCTFRSSVYFGTEGGQFYSLDLPTGHLRWSFATGKKIDSSASVANDTVFFGSGDGMIYALATEDGSIRWSLATDSPIYSSPLVADGKIYVSNKRKLYALDANTGKTLWIYDSGDDDTGQGPTLWKESVFLGTYRGDVLKLDRSTGALQWKLNNGFLVESTPAIAGGMVYFATWDPSQVCCCDVTSGRTRWTYKTTSLTKSGVAIYKNMVFFGDMSFSFYALSADKGKVVWRYTCSPVRGSASISQGIVYFGDQNGNLHALDWRTGKEIWKYQISAPICSTPAIADDLVIFGGDDSVLYAVGRR